MEEKGRNESNRYDKILKENLRKTLPTLIEKVLGLNVLKLEDLENDLQQTNERKPDLIKKVTESNGSTYLLHIEFQLADEKEMVLRMAEYYIMLFRKYKLETKQYVLYLRDNVPKMSTFIRTPSLFYTFELIAINTLPYSLFLQSNHPEVKLLSVLANLKDVDSSKMLVQLVTDLNKNSDLVKNKYFNQLRIFIQLRSSLEQQLDKAMESISKYFKEEKDYLYRKGEAKGEARGLEIGEARGLEIGEAKGLEIGEARGLEIGETLKNKQFVQNLILKMGFSDLQISELVEVPIQFVSEIRKNLNL